MKRTKLIPPFIMLMAGAIASILTYINDYEIKDMLFILLLVLIIFYILGLIVKKILDTYTVLEEELVADEGEVIVKEIIEKEEVNNAEGNVKNT